MHNLPQLKIWSKAIDLSVEIYKVSRSFPKEEQFGITNQMRRAVVSVSSNIAEGAGRNSDKEFIHFLSIAYGALFEVQTQLIIAQRLKLVQSQISDPVLVQIDELQKMIFGLQHKVQKQNTNS